MNGCVKRAEFELFDGMDNPCARMNVELQE